MITDPYIARKGENMIEVKINQSIEGGWVICGAIGISSRKVMERDGWTFEAKVQVPQGAWAVVAEKNNVCYVRWMGECALPWVDAWGKAHHDSHIAEVLKNGGRIIREGM